MFKRPVVVTVNAQVVWIVSKDPDSAGWVAACPPLNLTAEGDTFEELTKSQIEAIALLFQDLWADGEFEAFLLRNGWTAGRLPPAGTKVKFDVPFEVRSGSVEQMVGAFT